MARAHRVDILILGGGIAGLWILHTLRREGYDAWLIDRGPLGDAQTVRSQGILHRGGKYLLDPRRAHHGHGFPDLLPRWQACLDGDGEIDLHKVPVRSPGPWIWSREPYPAHLLDRLSPARQTRRVVPGTAPPALRRRRDLLRLEEPVLDMPRLLEALADGHPDRCLESASGELRAEARGGEIQVHDAGSPELPPIRARATILAAGAGNEGLLRQLRCRRPAMVRRPLRMVVATGPALPPLWLHAVADGVGPSFTITSHGTGAGGTLWYLGGDLSEEGAHRDPRDLCAEARERVRGELPHLDLEGARWASLAVERAEPRLPAGRRKLEPFVHQEGSLLVVWPSKMVFAPLVGDRVLEHLRGLGLPRGDGGSGQGSAAAPGWPGARPAPLPWPGPEMEL